MSTYVSGFPPPNYRCERMKRIEPPFEQCFYSPDQDHYVSGTLNSGVVWEADKLSAMKMAWLSAAVRGRLFVDVGANLGLFSLYAAAVGVERVIAFEPLAPNVGLIVASLMRNNGFMERVHVVAAGAGSAISKQTMWVDLINRGGSSFSSSKLDIESVPRSRQQVVHNCTLVTLDAFVRERVGVMKIDIEGFESCAVVGARHLFREHGVTMIFLEFWCDVAPCHASARELFDELLSFGYSFFSTYQEFISRRAPIRSYEAICGHTTRKSAVHDLFLVREDLYHSEMQR